LNSVCESDSHLKDGEQVSENNKNRSKIENTKQNLSLNLSTALRETTIAIMNSATSYESLSDEGTDESPTTVMSSATSPVKEQNELLENTNTEPTNDNVNELQPSLSSIGSDTQEWIEWINWPSEGSELEDVSPSTKTTSVLSTSESSSQTPQSGSEAQRNQVNSEMALPERIDMGRVGLGFMETPAVGNVPCINGELNGKPCRIMLDIGCGTYAISKAFADANGIEAIPTPPIPLELAEETDDERVIHQILTGTTSKSKSQTKTIHCCPRPGQARVSPPSRFQSSLGQNSRQLLDDKRQMKSTSD
jgi:hypothetical protein